MSVSAPGSDRAVSVFAQLWSEVTATVLEQLSSSPYSLQESSAENMPLAGPTDVHVVVTAAGTARGEMSLRIPADSALALTKVITKKADASGSELSQEDRSALEEVIRQIAGQVSIAARPKGLEIQLTVTLSEAPTWSAGASGWLSAPA